MQRAWISITLAAVAACTFAFGACGGEINAECVECGGLAGGAVRCYLPNGGTEDFCAPDDTLAAAMCLELEGTYVVYPLCIEEDTSETEEGGNNQPWEPGRYIQFDPGSTEYIVDFYAYEELKQEPARLFADKSLVSLDEAGRYQVLAEGELSEALGWELGDVLLSVNDFPLTGLEGLSAAYTELEDELQLTLVVERRGAKLELHYRVE